MIPVMTDAQPWPCERCGRIVEWGDHAEVEILDCGRYINGVVHVEREVCRHAD